MVANRQNGELHYYFSPVPRNPIVLRAFDRVIKNPILLSAAKYNPRGPITFSITAFNCALLFDAGIVPLPTLFYVNQEKKLRAKMFTRILESDRQLGYIARGVALPPPISPPPYFAIDRAHCTRAGDLERVQGKRNCLVASCELRS